MLKEDIKTDNLMNCSRKAAAQPINSLPILIFLRILKAEVLVFFILNIYDANKLYIWRTSSIKISLDTGCGQ